MHILKNWPIACLVFLVSFASIAQNLNIEELAKQPYDSIVRLYDLNRNDTVQAKMISRAYLRKGQINKDSTRMARGYERLATVSKYEDALRHLDSAIYLAQNSPHNDYPATLYLGKGRLLYYGNEYEESLTNTIKGYNAAKAKGSVVYEMVGLRGISVTNSLWGEHRKSLEAKFAMLQLLEENKDNPKLKRMYKMAYISTLSGVGTSYEQLKMPDSSLYFYEKAILAALKEKDTANYYDIVERSGAALYAKGAYEAALDSLEKGFSNKKIFVDYTTYPFYKGSIYYKQGKQEEGIEIFKKIDSTYKSNQVLYPELTSVYKTLVNYYKEQENSELQLQYLNDLIVVDSLVSENNKHVKDQTVKDYEIPLLLKEKNELLASLEAKDRFSKTKIGWAFAFAGLSLIGLGYYFRKQRLYKKRFERLIEDQQKETLQNKEIKSSKKASTLPPETVTHILEKLKLFEERKGFVEQEVTLQNLSKIVDTNSNYLSKVINSEKGVNFTKYLSDLRLEHSAKRLREDYKFRRYTIKAISKESGFGTSESFSKAFYKKYRIYPSYYIRQLENK